MVVVIRISMRPYGADEEEGGVNQLLRQLDAGQALTFT